MAEVIQDLAGLLLSGRPLIDLRAPIEFNDGAFPQAINLPLMTDEERALVGTCYKQKGQEAAITLGHQLVGGAVRAERMASWIAFIQAHPDAVLYCFRGGLRSQTVQQWLAEAGYPLPRVEGGYKALRQTLISEIEQSAAEDHYLVLTGMTGSAKTHLLQEVKCAIDLEGLANHRGSAFGKLPDGQPTPIEFENRLALQLLQRRKQGEHLFVVEDESRLIGRCPLPLPLFRRMEQAPLVLVEATFEQRAQQIHADYVVDLWGRYQQQNEFEAAWQLFGDHLRTAFNGVRKRLGEQNWHELVELLELALAEQARSGNSELHFSWIEALLTRYYDPMYSYQLSRKVERVQFKGSRAECVEYLNHLQN